MAHVPSIRNRFVGVNVPPTERLASILAGGALAALGMRRRSLGGFALAALGGGLVARGVTGRCPMFRMRALRKGIEVRRSVTIQCLPVEAYALCRDLASLPRFMHHVRAIEEFADGTSRWLVDTSEEVASRSAIRRLASRIVPGRHRFEWRGVLVEDLPGRRIRWRSMPGGDLENEGSLDFREAPAERGTIVEVRIRYLPPGGRFITGMLGGFLRLATGLELAEELARLRMLLETGELATGAKNPSELSPAEKVGTTQGLWPGEPAGLEV